MIVRKTNPRVLVTVPNLAGGGAERIAIQLTDGLVRRGWPVTLLLHERLGPLEEILPKGLSVVHGHTRPYRRTDLLLLFWKTLLVARRSDVIIAANEGRAACLAIAAGFLLRKPVIGWVHIDWRSFSEDVSWRTRFGLIALRACKFVVAVSEGARKGAVEHIGLDPNKTGTILNGVPIRTVRQLGELALPVEHQSWFLGDTVVAVGRLDRAKGFDLLIRAFGHLHRLGRSTNLVIVGQGGELHLLQKYAREEGIEDYVHFAGFQANPYRYMAKAKILALSSRYEGFALVLVEALAVGTPIVAVDCLSGPREILEGGRYGHLVVPSEDDEALAKGLARMLDDEAARSAFSASGRTRADEFDSSAFLSRWERLISRIGERPTRPVVTDAT